MRTLTLAGFVIALGATAGAIADTPAVPRAAIRAAELSLDERLSRTFPDNPSALVGTARGIYLEGYGAVFTAEMEPVTDGTSLMNSTLRPEQKVEVLKKKVNRIPDLRKAMENALVETAASLDPVPLDEQVVLEVVIDRFLWEDGKGYPAELIVQAPRRKLLDIKHANGAGMDAIRLTQR